LTKEVCGDPRRAPLNLTERGSRCVLTAEKDFEPNHSLIADGGNLDSHAIAHFRVDRDHAGQREIDELARLAGLENSMPGFHVQHFQIRFDPLWHVARKGSEKKV